MEATGSLAGEDVTPEIVAAERAAAARIGWAATLVKRAIKNPESDQQPSEVLEALLEGVTKLARAAWDAEGEVRGTRNIWGGTSRQLNDILTLMSGIRFALEFPNDHCGIAELGSAGGCCVQTAGDIADAFIEWAEDLELADRLDDAEAAKRRQKESVGAI